MKLILMLVVIIGLLSCKGNTKKAIELNNKASKLLQTSRMDSAFFLYMIKQLNLTATITCHIQTKL